MARRRGVLAALILVAALCNVGKAVHMDDTAYLEMARGILAHPLRPMSVEINWDQFAQPAYLSINTPPLLPYVLAGSMLVFGESDLALHATMAVIAGLVILCFYRVANRVIPRHALLLTALFGLSPAFLPGQNLMTDVPLVGTWLWCVDVLLAAGGTESRATYWPAGVAVAVACLIKYTSLALIPLVVFTLVYRRQYRSLWIVTIPVGVLAGWCAWNYLEFGGFHLFSRPNTFHVSSLGPHAMEWIAGVGVAAPFGFVCLARRVDGWLSTPMRVLPLIAGASVFFSTRAVAVNEPQLAWLWAVSVGVSVTLLLSIGEHLLSEWRNRDDSAAGDQSAILGLWFLAAMGSVVLIAPFMAMRHILPAVPAILLLCGRSAGSLLDRRWVAVLCVSVTVSLGFALALSDYTYANVYRKYAVQAARAGVPGSQVWAVGHWGWQWYARKAGLAIYDQHTTLLRPGDFVIVPNVASRQELRPDHRQQLSDVMVVRVNAPSATYLRTMGWGAGYYAFFWTWRAFPFRFTKDTLEEFTLYRVDR